MKRTLVRLAVLAAIMVLGLITIAQAQRETPGPVSENSRYTESEKMPAKRVAPVVAAPAKTGSFAKPSPLGNVLPESTRPVAAPTANPRKPAARYSVPSSFPAVDRTQAVAEDEVPAQPRDGFPARLPPRGSAEISDVPALNTTQPADLPEQSIPASSRPRFLPENNAAEPVSASDDAGQAEADADAEVPAIARPAAAGRTRKVPAAREVRPVAATNDAFEPAEDEPVASPAARPGSRFSNDNAAGHDPGREAQTPEGTGTPGGKHLEGQQTPSLSVHKIAPREMQVGKPATIEIVVRNTGSVPAHRVELHDQIPKGTRFLDATPSVRKDPQGELAWSLQTLQPAEETTVRLRVVPLTEGEVGSVASVTFTADATARSIVTRPQLTVELSAPKSVMINQDITFSVKVSNPGSGIATGVVLRDAIPAGLKHPAGPELEYEIGDLAPNETRTLELTLRAAEAGRQINTLDAIAADDVRAKTVRTEIEIIAPALELTAAGPKRRFLERQAVYTVSLSNPGTAPAQQVELIATLPEGMEFVKADNSGRYDPKTRAVHWLLDELPPERTGSVTLTALPIQAGVQAMKFEASAQEGLSAESQQEITVEGVAAVLFQVADVADPIEVGGESAYEIRVVNQGSKIASNVRVTALLPDQLEFLDADGPSKHAASGQRVVFEPIARLAPKADTTFRVKVRGAAAGDVRFRVQLITDEMNTPVTKEESTRIYADE